MIGSCLLPQPRPPEGWRADNELVSASQETEHRSAVPALFSCHPGSIISPRHEGSLRSVCRSALSLFLPLPHMICAECCVRLRSDGCSFQPAVCEQHSLYLRAAPPQSHHGKHCPFLAFLGAETCLSYGLALSQISLLNFLAFGWRKRSFFFYHCLRLSRCASQFSS